MPDEMSFSEGAAFPLCSLTAHFGLLRRGGLRADETVLVTGAAGGVGLAAVQIARLAGAKVIAVASTASKRDLALTAGADLALDADTESLRDRVLEATDGRGVDVVLENVGGDMFNACLRSLAWEGRLVVSGFAGGEIPVARANYLLVKNIAVVGLQVSDYRDREPDSWLAAQESLLNHWRSGHVRIVVQETYPLTRAIDALREISTRSAIGRIVLTTTQGEAK
jgi:NADPH2:quinone reductase